MPGLRKADAVSCMADTCARRQEHWCARAGTHCSIHCKCQCDECAALRDSEELNELPVRVVVTARGYNAGAD